MRWIHRATIEVFAKEEDDVQAVREALKAFVPFDLEKAKIKIKEQRAEGFHDKVINILEIELKKVSHTNAFLNFLLGTLSVQQKKLLVSQAESRLDKHFHFFVRFDKPIWMKSRKLQLTDGGNCFHMKLTLAAYPKKRETALPLVKELFSQKTI